MKETQTKDKATTNMSGNFETKDEDIEVVKAFLEKEKIPYEKIYKYEDANAGDVMVRFPNKLYSLFEVKRESQQRFSKFGEYGIDFISSLVFKKGVDKSQWKKLHNAKDLPKFMKSLDVKNPRFKWGKLGYSYSNVWLFYVQDEKTGKYTHLECYDGKKMSSDIMFNYIKNNCQFAVNIKPESQMSNSDKFDSATFYIKPSKLINMRITKDNVKDMYNHGNMGLLDMIDVA